MLNPELYTSLEQNEDNIPAFKRAHPELFDAMKEKGMIVESEQDEYKNLMDNWQQEDTTTDKFTIIINPTMDCNLRCWYCYEKHCIASRMSPETICSIKKLLEKKFESGLKNLNIAFFGGEPLLYFQETVVPILRYAKEKCSEHNVTLHIGFTTNGVLLSEREIEELKCYESVDLQITLDGDRETHDMTRCTQKGEPTYQKIIDNIKKGIAAGFHIMVRMNYTQDNAQSFINVIKEFRNLSEMEKKLLSFSFHKVWQESSLEKTESVIVETRQNFQEEGFHVHLPVEENEMRCYADKENQIVINYNGDLYKCTARDFTSESKEGILSNEGELIWNETYYKRMSLKSGNDTCKQCILFPICHGGCTQEKLETNQINGCRKGYSEDKKMDIIGKRLSKIT